MSQPRRFLTAEWRHLVMLNYPVDREILEPLVPPGTMLDTYKGRAYVSVIGFLFLKTKVLGVPIPLHQNFEEVNLRFYVRRFDPAGAEWRRGVVFIKELVPKAAIAAVARSVYNERYQALPMRHALGRDTSGRLISAEYGWRLGEHWSRLQASADAAPTLPRPGSIEEFITEHYWGYVRQRDGGCVEYRVEHPQWAVAPAAQASLECDAAALYGPAFAGPLAQDPVSAFIAEGSSVTVYRGQRLRI